MVKIYFNKTYNAEIGIENIKEISEYVAITMDLNIGSFYIEQNGKRINNVFNTASPLYVRLCVLGGKGGFGSMLRAIGAQIEKTTNREACRDLSGRRLRDINEEKRLKAWLDKQAEREREAEERKKRKIEKLLSVPKHEFKDDEYEEARSKLTEKVCNAVEEGFKKAKSTETGLKRKNGESSQHVTIKKKKSALWLDDDIASSDGTDEQSEDDENSKDEKIPSEESSITFTSCNDKVDTVDSK